MLRERVLMFHKLWLHKERRSWKVLAWKMNWTLRSTPFNTLYVNEIKYEKFTLYAKIKTLTNLRSFKTFSSFFVLVGNSNFFENFSLSILKVLTEWNKSKQLTSLRRNVLMSHCDNLYSRTHIATWKIHRFILIAQRQQSSAVVFLITVVKISQVRLFTSTNLIIEIASLLIFAFVVISPDTTRFVSTRSNFFFPPNEN